MSKQKGYKMFRLYFVADSIKLSWKNMNAIRDVDRGNCGSGVSIRGWFDTVREEVAYRRCGGSCRPNSS